MLGLPSTGLGGRERLASIHHLGREVRAHLIMFDVCDLLAKHLEDALA